MFYITESYNPPYYCTLTVTDAQSSMITMAPQEELNLLKRDREPSSDTDSYYSTPNQSPGGNSLDNYLYACMCVYTVYVQYCFVM